MEKTIFALQNSKHVLIESPTGTGKTLSLLCSTLSWLRNEKNSLNSLEEDQVKPKVIYATRTHSQIKQLIGEIKTTSYSDLKICFLGSRDQLCINETIRKEKSSNINARCKNIVAANKCFYKNQMRNSDIKIDNLAFDIEELTVMGKNKSFCPYYYSKEFAKDADLIFMPYNYILDKKIRKRNDINFESSVIIFDEAHNLEKNCEDSFSLELKESDLATATEELTAFAKHLRITKLDLNEKDSEDGKERKIKVTFEQVLAFKGLLLRLEASIKKITQGNFKEYSIKPAIQLYEAIIECDFKENDIREVIGQCVKHHNLDTTNSLSKGIGCDKVGLMLEFFQLKDFGRLEDYIVCVKNSPLKNSHPIKFDKTICLWCLNPAIAIKSLMALQVRSMIFASGTLSPIDDFINSLGLEHPIVVQNSHVIQSTQLSCDVCIRGPGFVPLTSTFTNRSNSKYLTSLATALDILAKIIPKGILVFFPSFSFLEDCYKFWEEQNLLCKITKTKPVFVEPRSKENFNEVISEYFEACEKKHMGAIMLAVCRAKMSEGIDFSNDKCRAVIIIGLPFPQKLDPKVNAKMTWVNNRFVKLMKENKSENIEKIMSSNTWYINQAAKTVNQAIGRVIRHVNDYGMIILLDKRFDEESNTKNLPQWIAQVKKQNYNFAATIRSVKEFFVANKQLQSLFDKNKIEQDELYKKSIDNLESEARRPKFEFSSTNWRNELHYKYAKPITLSDYGLPEKKDEDFYKENYNDNSAKLNGYYQTNLAVRKIASQNQKKMRTTKKPKPGLDSSDSQFEMIKKFRGLLKSSLSKSSYKEFTGFIAEYKQTKDCKKFVDNVLTIPLQKKVYDEIFLSFGEFIDKTHRNEYYELIKSPQIETLKGDEKENLKNCENTSSSNDKT